MNTEETQANILNGAELLKDVFNDVLKWDVVDTGISVVSSNTKVIKLIQTFKDIPSQLFCRKLIRFLNGIKDIPINKRKEFIDKFGKQLKNNYERIFNIINNIDDEKKCDYLTNLFKSLVYEKIDFTMFIRLTKYIEKTLSEDLNFIKNNIKKEKLTHNIGLLDLANNGLVYSIGFSFSGGTNENSLYNFTDLALKLYEYGLKED